MRPPGVVASRAMAACAIATANDIGVVPTATPAAVGTIIGRAPLADDPRHRV